MTEDDRAVLLARINDRRCTPFLGTGYFIGLKGKRNVPIIREAGSKMPADLGGDIYGSLQNKADIAPIEKALTKRLPYFASQ